MSRPLRIEYPGAFYHITSRGNERKAIFKSKDDHLRFFAYLKTATERYAASIHAYILMDNHYHLLLETPEGNLSAILHHLNAGYTIYFNKKRQRSGHLFQGRYKAILVDRDAYAVELSRYIHLNPVRAGMVGKAEEYYWSSLKGYLWDNQQEPWLNTRFILQQFGEDENKARKRYREFVNEVAGRKARNPFDEVTASTFLGRESFINWVKDKFLAGRGKEREIPALRALEKKVSISEIKEAVAEILKKEDSTVRKISLYLCHRFSGRPLKDIGDAFGGIGPSAVAQNTRRVNQRKSEDEEFKRLIDSTEKTMLKSEKCRPDP